MLGSFWLKSGDYLSSRRLTVSTFGVKELNFCVRNGYRWILFAIITAIVIFIIRHFRLITSIRCFFNLLLKTDNYIASFAISLFISAYLYSVCS